MREVFTIGYISYMMVMIKWLNDPLSEMRDGYINVAIFGSLMALSILFNNAGFFRGYLFSLNIRKIISISMMEKVSRLSMKSLTETNSGKLVTIVSGEYQAIERMLSLSPMLIATPFINILAYGLLGYTTSWEFAVFALIFWIVLILLQHYSSVISKMLKLKEAVHNDERQKLVNDMVVGARTIKCYAWENFYTKNLKKSRKAQTFYIYS